MTDDTLVDANVLIELATDDSVWGDWSARALARAGQGGRLLINPIVYAEISIAFERIEEVDTLVPAAVFYREDRPGEAAFLVGKAFHAYRRRGGTGTLPLPDFFIGADAAVRGYRLLTRDAARFRTYFPTLDLVTP